MTPNIKTIFKNYSENPTLYIENMPNTAKSDSANILLALLKYTNNDLQLQELIRTKGVISIKYIVSSVKKNEDIINLINLMYLSGVLGTIDIAEYYKTDYKHLDGNLELKDHCQLIKNLISKFIAQEKTAEFNKKWFIESIVSLTHVLTDIINNLETFEPRTLAPLMKIHHIINKMNLRTTQKIKIITAQTDTITEYLYGLKKERVLEIAKSLDLAHDQNYWHACLYDFEQDYNDDDLLPTS